MKNVNIFLDWLDSFNLELKESQVFIYIFSGVNPLAPEKICKIFDKNVQMCHRPKNNEIIKTIVVARLVHILYALKYNM